MEGEHWYNDYNKDMYVHVEKGDTKSDKVIDED